MSDNRRISKAYLFGFSNEPFKPVKPPEPPKPSPYTTMLRTPGGLTEWVASDGRKGALTGKGKARLTAANLAAVPNDVDKERKRSKVKSKAKSGKSAAIDGGNDPFGGLFDQGDDSAGFTKEQDDKIMEMKNTIANLTWDKVAEEVGKDKKLCKDRFNNVLKPKDWRPPNAEKKEKGKGKGKKCDGSANKNKGNDKKSEEKKSEKGDAAQDTPWGDATLNFGGSAKGNDEPWNADNEGFGNENWVETSKAPENNNSGGAQGVAWGGEDGFGISWDYSVNNGGWLANTWTLGNTDGTNDQNPLVNNWEMSPDGNAGGPTSNSKPASKSGSTAPWNVEGDWPGAAPANSKPASKAGSNSPWGPAPTTPKPASKSGSKTGAKPTSSSHTKKHSKHGSVAGSIKSIAAGPFDIELKPDDNFSSEDLALVARIMKQDFHMIWDRVSWRFRDKTGRNINPKVFREKVTGVVSGK